MESESDWDSISGEGPDLRDVSVSMAADSSRHQKHTPRPPSAERHMSPKIPLQRASMEFKNPPRVAEQYRNMSIKDRLSNQAITTFKDSGGITLEKDDAVPSRKNTPSSPEQRNFHEIELKDNPMKYNMFQANTEKRKKSQLKDSNENLPYTEFEASDMSPRKNDPLPKNQQLRKKAHQEYITRSPAPETPDAKIQRKATKNDTQLAQISYDIDKAPKAGKKNNKNSKIKKQSVISNENADGYYDSRDTEEDVSWADHQQEARIYHQQEAKAVNLVPSQEIVLKSSGQIMLEERYKYENAVRNYHSIYIQNEAKMPVIADKVENLSRRGIQEFFGALQIIVDFFVIFIIESIRFVMKQFVRKLIGGTLSAFGDFLTKPVFSSLFNSIIQPLFVLIWNVLHGLRKLSEPVLLLTRELSSQAALVIGALRLVQINSKTDSRMQNV